MKELNKPLETTYWIAYSDDKKIICWGITEPDNVTTTGQPNFEYSINKQDIIDRLKNLGYETKFYDQNNDEILPTNKLDMFSSGVNIKIN
jgi:hypothetical protein